jgi:hypothetical protein
MVRWNVWVAENPWWRIPQLLENDQWSVRKRSVGERQWRGLERGEPRGLEMAHYPDESSGNLVSKGMWGKGQKDGDNDHHCMRMGLGAAVIGIR